MNSQSFAASKKTLASDDMEQYRAVSKAAIFSIAIMILSLLSFVVSGLLFLPVIGAICGWVGRSKVKRQPEVLTGGTASLVGLVGSASIFVLASVMHVTVYLTEVPEGYERISFYQLQPDERRPELPVSPESLDLNGKRVFVKGYVHKSIAGMGPVKNFVLVPDLGTCCFGGQPKLTDMIEVTIKDDQSIRYSRTQRKLAGVLKVDTRLKPLNGLQGTYYQLEAEVVQ